MFEAATMQATPKSSWPQRDASAGTGRQTCRGGRHGVVSSYKLSCAVPNVCETLR